MGLLDQVFEPDCPDGHGRMMREPGFWAYQGVSRFGPGTDGKPILAPNNTGLIVKVWTCPKCKLTRAYSDDAEE